MLEEGSALPAPAPAPEEHAAVSEAIKAMRRLKIAGDELLEAQLLEDDDFYNAPAAARSRGEGYTEVREMLLKTEFEPVPIRGFTL